MSKKALLFSGYAALFDVADQARDTIRKGAFARSIRKRGTYLPLLSEHDPNQRIGQIELVAEDRRGLRGLIAVAAAPPWLCPNERCPALALAIAPIMPAICRRDANCSPSTCWRSAWSRIPCSPAPGSI